MLTGESRGVRASGVCQGAARPCLPGFSAALQARKQGCTPCADQGRHSGSLPRAAPGVMCTSGNPGLQCPTGNICSLLLPWLSAPLLALPSPVPLARRCAQQLPILPASPKALFASSCLPHCLPWHYTCPQKPSAQPVSLGWAWKGAWLPSHAGSDQVQTAQSHPWGLMPICGIHRALGHRTGDALAVGPQYPLSLPAHPVSPFSHTLTVQLHARLGASALHLPPWGQRLLPGSHPPSMEGSGGAGSPRAAQPGRRPGAAPAQHGAALRLQPGRPAEAARFPVVSPLTFKQNRSGGPGPGGRLPASSRFLPWLGAREGRPWAHLPPGLSTQQPAPQWSVPQLCLPRERGQPCRKDGVSDPALDSPGNISPNGVLWQPGMKATKNHLTEVGHNPGDPLPEFNFIPADLYPVRPYPW